ESDARTRRHARLRRIPQPCRFHGRSRRALRFQRERAAALRRADQGHARSERHSFPGQAGHLARRLSQQGRIVTHELKTGGNRGYLRIATEEAFATQEQFDAILRLVKEGRADKGTESLWGFYGTSPS